MITCLLIKIAARLAAKPLFGVRQKAKLLAALICQRTVNG
jgi:hypothetical protein